MGDLESGKKNTREKVTQLGSLAAVAIASGLAGAAIERNRMDSHLNPVPQQVDTIKKFEVPQEALDFVEDTNALFSGTENLLPAELTEKVTKAVDEYVKAELARAEATQSQEGPFSTRSHPLSDLWSAIQARADMNPIQQGVILSIINKRFKSLGEEFTYDSYGSYDSYEDVDKDGHPLDNPLSQKDG